MEIHAIEHGLLDATGEENPILKDKVIERNIFNYLIFSKKLKLRLMPKKFNKLIPNLDLHIKPKIGKVNNQEECEVKKFPTILF